MKMRWRERRGHAGQSARRDHHTFFSEIIHNADASNTHTGAGYKYDCAQRTVRHFSPKAKTKLSRARGAASPPQDHPPHLLPPSSPASDHHVARGWIKSEARRAGSALLRAGCRHAGLPGGARADPLRPVFSGAAESVSGGGARLRRGAAGARLRMLPRLRPAGRRAVRDLHGAVRLRPEVHPETRRPPAAARSHPGTGCVHGQRRAPVHPRAPADTR